MSIQGQSAQTNKEKKPDMVILLFSVFLVGFGQVHNGDLKRGVLFLIGTLAGILIFPVLGIIVWGYHLYDAYSTEKKMCDGEIPFKEGTTWDMILYIIVLIVAAFIFIMLGTVVNQH